MISNPEAVEKLNCYNMWQSFLISSSIKLGLVKITAFTIMHQILRPSLSQPKISIFMLNTPNIDFTCNLFQVHNPSPLLSFGFYFPIKRMPELRIFKVDEFEEQLRLSAQQFLIERVKIKEDHHLIMMPKFIEWYC